MNSIEFLFAVHEQSTQIHMEKVVYICSANWFWKETQFYILLKHFTLLSFFDFFKDIFKIVFDKNNNRNGDGKPIYVILRF